MASLSLSNFKPREPHYLLFTMAASLTFSKLLSSTTVRSYLLPPKTLASKLPLIVKLNYHHFHPKPLRFSTISVAIGVDDKLPEATFSYLDSVDEVKIRMVSKLTKGNKAVLLMTPSAFTPTCSQKHVPGFVEKSMELKAKGMDTIACISVNMFMMKAWKDNLEVNDEVLLLSDGNRTFTKIIGCKLDLSDNPVGLGVRSRRYILLAEDGVVKFLNLEKGGAFIFSGADDILKVL